MPLFKPINDYSFYAGPLIKYPYYATTKHAYIPLDDYSAKAFNYLVYYRRVLDAFIAIRASRRLKVRVARERAYFLYYLDAAEYDPNSRVGNVRLRKDANKVKRSPLAIATFREEDSEDDLLDATNASAYRRNPSESSSDSEGNDAPSPNSAASGPNSTTSAVAITAASS
ncbi:hypothetical protein D6C87_10708 [Aureobasidium pullulans]|uniref:Uncharacterized protein n=1 Tax=Aureobasidium pullulans TaxID=5580 RepID=A0AB38LGN0_AURPU|nr:hypothetical protein D6C94_10770 [Aureobasidium pullulans]THZ33798.1 hypothetical protein D6C87_10708 [Aureobasidium pullulans]